MMKTITAVILLMAVLFLPDTYGQKAKKYLKVSGHVTIMNKRPVTGALIIVDNQNTGAITDKKGFYKIKVNGDSKMIGALSSSGEIIESAINGQSELNLTYPDKVYNVSHPQITKNNDEDEVNIGYGTINKRDLLTPVGRVDGTHSRYSSYTSIYDMLRGQPGVLVNGRSVIIQGISTIYGSTEPLYVLDGSIVSTIDGIPPRMVKSIEILKGPSASIYGSRGANGVILVTLLKAKK
jgi:TonB-dependent SusC/RagA subfamily outer membrane receptor